MSAIKKLKKEEEEDFIDDRVGQRWSLKEENVLKDLIEKGRSIDEISNKLKRRGAGIRARILKMALDMQKNGQSLSEIQSKLVHVSEEKLKEFQQQQQLKENDKKSQRKEIKDDNLTTTLLTQILTNQLEMNKKLNQIMDDLYQ